MITFSNLKLLFLFMEAQIRVPAALVDVAHRLYHQDPVPVVYFYSVWLLPYPSPELQGTSNLEPQYLLSRRRADPLSEEDRQLFWDVPPIPEDLFLHAD